MALAGRSARRATRVLICALLGSPVLAPSAQAQAAAPGGARVIEVRGTIQPALLPRLRAALEVVDPERFPAGALILLDSPGGDGLVALEAGRMLRAAKAHVYVHGRCASACVFLLAAGVVRGAVTDGSVAIHRPRLTAFVKDIGVVDINAATNPKAELALELASRRMQDYLGEMGMPEALYKAMMAAYPDQSRHLSLAELAEFGLSGFDPDYRAARAAGGAQKYAIAQEEFVRRTLRMPELCLGAAALPRDIYRCYRRVLEAGA